MNLLDDSLSADLAKTGTPDAAMTARSSRWPTTHVGFRRECQLRTALAEGRWRRSTAASRRPTTPPSCKPPKGLAQGGCRVIALAQFSMARARPALEQSSLLRGLPVPTTPDPAVRRLRAMLGR